MSALMEISKKEIASLIYDKDLLPEPHFRIQSLVPIEQGMTNRNYLCTVETGEKYVIRIPRNSTSEMIDRISEWENHYKIDSLNLNTKHVAYLKGSWIKSSVYIEDCFEMTASKYMRIDIACEALRTLHHSGIIFSNRFWAPDMLTRYENIAKRNNVRLNRIYLSLREIFKYNFDNFLYSKIKWTACHNDLVKENILLDTSKNIYLIDWEYSGMNDTLWDLTSFILENGLTPTEEQYMIEQYHQGKDPRPESPHIIALFKVYQDMLWYLWASIKGHYGDQDDNYAEKRIQRALRNYTNLNCKRPILQLSFH